MYIGGFCACVIIMEIMFADPTLTVDSLVTVMEKVTSDEGRRRKVWERVLRWRFNLDLMRTAPPYSYPDEIYSKYTTAKEKIHALADVYVNSRPESSWQHLLQTLYDESEMAAAKEAKSFLQQKGTCT